MSSISSKAGLTTPFFQKSIDFGRLKNKIADAIAGRSRPDRPKISENRDRGKLIAKSKTAGRTNLGGMQRAAAQKLAKKKEAEKKAGTNTGDTARVHPTPKRKAQVLAPTRQKPSGPPKKDVPLNPKQKFEKAQTDVAMLRGHLAELGRAQEKARSDVGLGLTSGGREGDLIGKRDKVAKEVKTLLDQVSAQIKDPATDGETKKGLMTLRSQLLSAMVSVEFPQVLEHVAKPFDAPLPKGIEHLPSRVPSDIPTQDQVRRLDKDAKEMMAKFDDFGCLRPGESLAGRTSADLDQAITSLEFEGETSNRRDLTPEQQQVLGHLKDLKAALDFRAEMHAIVGSADKLQSWIEADKTRPNPGLSRLFREFTQYGSVFHDASSSKPSDRLNALQTVGGLVELFADKNVPALFRTEHPGVKSLMTSLRTAHLEEQAVRTFLDKLPKGRDPVRVFLSDVDKHVNSGKPLTIAELQKIAPKSIDDMLTNLKADVAKAVQLHESYDDQFRRVERILGHDKAGLYRGAVFLQMGQPTGGHVQTDRNGPSNPVPSNRRPVDSVVFESRAIKDLKKLGEDNPEAAFMVAGLAFLEHQLATVEKNVIGRKEYDNIQIETYDHARVMAFAGVTPERMQKLGYAPDVAASLPERMYKLSKAGFRTAEELDKSIQELMDDASKIFTDRSVQSIMSSFKEDSAAAIGREIRLETFTEVHGIGGGVVQNGGRVDASLTHESLAVVEGYNRIAKSINNSLRTGADIPIETTTAGQVFREVDRQLEDTLLERDKIDNRETQARKDLVEASKEGSTLGIDVNPDRPAGLRSAKVVQEVLRLDGERKALERIGVTKGSTVDKLDKAIDTLLEKLRGYDTTTMRRPWHAKLFPLLKDKPDIDKLRGLSGVADKIVFVREGADAERKKIDERLPALTELRGELAAQRRTTDPTAFGTAEQMIRSAILAHWPGSNVTESVGSGRVVDGYEPMLHRDAIEKTLKSWGLDTEVFGPEISMALGGTLTRHDLKAWAEERRPIDPNTLLISGPDTRSIPKKLAESFVSFLRETFSKQGVKDAVGWLVNKKEMDADFQRDILAQMTTLKDGDKYDLKAGFKVSGTTGKIPVEPSATLGIRGKLAGSKISNLVIERGGDGWKITGRSGFQVQGGVDVVADHKLTDNLALGGSLGVEGTYGYLGGSAFTFPDTVAGRDAFARLLTALVNGERPSPEIFEHTNDAARQKEHARKGGVVGKGYFKAELTTSPFGTDGDMFHDNDVKGKKSGASNKVGIGFTAGLDATAFLSGKGKTTKSFNKITRETETELSGSLGASAQFYAKVPTGLGALSNAIATSTGLQKEVDQSFNETDAKGNQKGLYDVGSGTANENLLNWELSTSLVRTKKTKQEFSRANSEGGEERLTKSEIVQRTSLTLGADIATIGVGSKDLADRLATDTDFRSDYEALKKFMGVNDSLQLTYSVKPEIMERFNDMMQVAHEEAAPLASIMIRRAAAKLLDDMDNYEVSKVTVWSKDVQKDSVNRGNAMLMKLDFIAEVGHEESEVVWKVPPRKK